MTIPEFVLSQLQNKKWHFCTIKEQQYLCRLINKNELDCIKLDNGKNEKITFDKISNYEESKYDISLSSMQYCIKTIIKLLKNELQFEDKNTEQIVKRTTISVLKSFN